MNIYFLTIPLIIIGAIMLAFSIWGLRQCKSQVGKMNQTYLEITSGVCGMFGAAGTGFLVGGVGCLIKFGILQ